MRSVPNTICSGPRLRQAPPHVLRPVPRRGADPRNAACGALAELRPALAPSRAWHLLGVPLRLEEVHGRLFERTTLAKVIGMEN